MRGAKDPQTSLVCLVDVESRIPQRHPIREVKTLVDGILREMSPLFDEMYAAVGRPSIPPESLLKATVLMALYSVRSDRMFCEQLDYNMLFRWFLDMDMTEGAFHPTTFSKNRERLMDHDVARSFFAAVVAKANAEKLTSSEHFTVDGTLVEAWASLKSFRPKDESAEERPASDGSRNPTVNFHGQKRRNETHASTTDPDARLARKGFGKEAKLSYAKHVLMENRNGLIVDLVVTHAHGRAEVEAAATMIGRLAPTRNRRTLAADKGYDTRAFVARCRELKITPHVAMNTKHCGGSAIDGRTSRHEGYTVSQRVRKRVEEIFGWDKTVGHFRRTRLRGRERTEMAALFVGASYNLLRIAKLLLGSA
ncbi:MAG: IS5 family transposase [Myxococcales bacterium]|nr:IS5 family transposase [Myxococcales bacterium]